MFDLEEDSSMSATLKISKTCIPQTKKAIGSGW